MDDKGVLEGRWTDTYPKNCTRPWEWTGSVEILEQFWKKKKTVKYGQCWVFSGLATTCKLLNNLFTSHVLVAFSIVFKLSLKTIS